MKHPTTRLAVLAAALLALPACSDRSSPLAPSSQAGSSVAAKPQGSSITKPITGTLVGTTTQVFNGTFTLSKFAVQNGQLMAVGTLAGTLTDAAGNLVGNVNQQVAMPVAAVSGSCQILHLELGPLDLDLLGLQIHLNKVVLDITAQSGPGNLLGNLLCAIANLLNGGLNLSILNSLVGLLNQVIALA